MNDIRFKINYGYVFLEPPVYRANSKTVEIWYNTQIASGLGPVHTDDSLPDGEVRCYSGNDGKQISTLILAMPKQKSRHSLLKRWFGCHTLVWR